MSENSRPIILSKIESMEVCFSKAERKISRYMLEHFEEMAGQTITELSEKTGASEASIVRFCKKIGFRGFYEFKTNLERNIVSQSNQIHQHLVGEDDVISLKNKIMDSHVRTIETTKRTLDDQQFLKAVELLEKASRVLLVGFGTSGIAAADAYFKMSRIGLNCLYSPDIYVQMVHASQLSERDVIIAVSHSGTNKDILEIVALAKQNSAAVLSITQTRKSPLQASSDVVLATPGSVTTGGDNRAERIAQLSVIDALYTALTFVDPQQTCSALDRSINATITRKI